MSNKALASSRHVGHRLHNLVNTYRNHIAWHGLLRGHYYFVQHVWLRVLAIAINYEVFYILTKQVIPDEHRYRDERALCFEQAALADFDALRQINPNRIPKFIEERMASNEICYVARSVEDAMCAYFWVAPGKRVIAHRRVQLSLGIHDVYIRDIHTLPQYRGRGITPECLRWLNNKFARDGKHVMWSLVVGGNVSSLRAFRKAGFRVHRKLRFASLSRPRTCESSPVRVHQDTTTNR